MNAVPQSIPGRELREAGQVGRLCIAGSRLGMSGLELVLGSFVKAELALDSAEAVGSGADQVSLYIFEIILIQLQLGFGQVNLLLQNGFVIFLRSREIFLQLVNVILISLDRSLHLISSSE
jgi:hypothetical protein